jgi:2-keto-4-pentenoate hydratase/2-oxohepta-3-ene-1,7-dioic acid hydratase in catechol pathway
MKIICVGRNYNDHIKELKNQKPQSPVLFIKPDTSLCQPNLPFYIPNFTNDVQYEAEVKKSSKENKRQNRTKKNNEQ